MWGVTTDKKSVKKFSGGERGEVILKSVELKLFTAAENNHYFQFWEYSEKVILEIYVYPTSV